MVDFRIAVELGHLIPEGAPFRAEHFPNLAQAVRMIAEAAHEQWRRYAAGQDALPDGQRMMPRTGEYERSIQLRQTGDFAAEVYSDLPYAQAVEEGTPARDMKRMLDSSLKVRLSKAGKRYLIIPFRWNTPNSVMGRNLPESVHDWWQDKHPSAIKGTYARLSGTGAFDRTTRAPLTVPGWKYRWGDRLSADALDALGIRGMAKRRMEGMVNFRKPGGVGAGAHSQFITFRVMVEGSAGWIAPAQPGKWPARTIAEALQPVAERAFAAAVAEDVAALMGEE